MPKRRNEDKIEHYQRKVKKLQQKLQQKQFRRIIYSSSSESDKSDKEIIDNDASVEIVGSENPTSGHEPTAPELDPDILSALGETTEEVSKFGPNVHDNLARLWQPILKKGLNKEIKDNLFKNYLVPENIPLLQAPKLNPEISAAVNESTRARDKKVEAVQQQLGHGIAALNKGLELLLNDDQDKLQAIKYFSDSCRLLCDLHFTETEARKKFVTPGLDKAFLNVMQDVERDETLFGNKLSDKIKATKAIEKHGLQIKKAAPVPKTSTTAAPSSSVRPRNQGNWQGPPRPSFSRGGRGGQRKAAPPARRAPAGSSAQTKPATNNKQRVTNQPQ